MLPYERGVSPVSELFESTPSKRAKNTLFYLQRAGYFHCSIQYAVSREYYPSFLLAVILSGSLEVHTENKTVLVPAGNTVFVNCHYLHSYRAVEPLEYIWIHFSGANTEAFYQEILKINSKMLFRTEQHRILYRVQQIIKQLRLGGRIQETAMSRHLHDLLCDLLYAITEQETEAPLIALAQRYIANNLNKTLSVDDMAKYCCVSPSHFTRLFRRHTGQSPHEYLINSRINKAKLLLKETQMSISEIAEAVGYKYDTSFTSAFRKKVGLSPLRFRNTSI